MVTQTSRAATETDSSQRSALIVGGGPAGLATAIMLARRGWQKITVLEKRPTADYYEPDKSYSYAIDGRGQKFTDLFGLTNQLSQISVPSTEFYLTIIEANGNRKTLKLPTVDPNRKTAYWLPRKAFLRLLYEEIERNWQDKINILFNTKCVKINKISTNNTPQEKLQVIAQKEDDSLVEFEPFLLVGCDGINSIVRNTLKEWDKTTSNRFDMQYFPSPSSNLRYKVITLPPQFPLDHDGKEKAVCDMAYSIRGAFRGRKRFIFLGVLPLKNPDDARGANIVTWPDHDVWKLQNSEEVYKFFEQAFPQLAIRQIISPQEAERFALGESSYFPVPQHCSGLHFLLNQEQTDEEIQNQSFAGGVVLLGDAIHCFPPDTGQGVNSALEDVCILNEALSQCKDDLKSVLLLYESLRFQDVKALIRLAQTAYPWQYNQDRLRKRLWSVNFILRLLLSRVLPFIFKPPAFYLIQNHQLSYQQIWSMAQRTTQRLFLFGLILICGFLALAVRLSQPLGDGAS
jgi:kynurenine 3-monooxygenase